MTSSFSQISLKYGGVCAYGITAYTADDTDAQGHWMWKNNTVSLG